MSESSIGRDAESQQRGAAWRDRAKPGPSVVGVNNSRGHLCGTLVSAARDV